MDDRLGFSRATKLVFLLLALLPVWYLLHEHYTQPDEPEPRAVTFMQTVVRISVGVIGFLAFILLVHGGKRPGTDKSDRQERKKSSNKQWFACSACGQRVQRDTEEISSRTTCPTCNCEFELNPSASSTAAGGSEEDVNKWLQELTEQRLRGKRN